MENSKTIKEPLIWLVTGTSSGFGRHLTLAALERGDRVIATSRKTSIARLADLQARGADVLELDVTDSLDNLTQIAQIAVNLYGKIDVLVNNAGYCDISACEEFTPEEDIGVFSTNLFGAMNVTRAILPHMREKNTGSILWIGSVAGWTTLPGVSIYSASKAALRSLAECLNTEISHLGLRSIAIETGFFRTEFIGKANFISSRIADYDCIVDPIRAGYSALNGFQPGDPQKAMELVVDIVHGEGIAQGREIPPVIGLGQDYYQAVSEYCKNTLRVMEEWKSITCSTGYDSVEKP